MFTLLAFVCIGLLWLCVTRQGHGQQDLKQRLEALCQRCDRLQRELGELQRRPSIAQRPASPEAPRAAAPEPPPAPPIQVPERKAVQDAPRSVPIKLSSPAPPPAAAATPGPVASALQRQATQTGGWEALIGGNLLNKLGALVLVTGIALFLSYSFARMGPTGRAFTALGVSAAVLAGGVRLERRERYKAFSRGLMAAGWGSLYLTAYAMHALPAAKIIDSPIMGVFAVMAVAAGMVAHSLKYKVESLTSLSYGTVFGALALSAQSAFAVVALVPLAGSMLYLARRFGWHGMALFGAAATYVTFLTRPTEGSPLVVVQSLLLLYWVMFEAFDLLRLKSAPQDTLGTLGLFWLNALAGLGSSAALWGRMAPDDMWQFCAAGSALYLASTWVRFLLDQRSKYEFALVISALLACLSVFAGAPGIWSSVGLLMEAEVLFLAGLYLRLRLAHVLSSLAFASAFWQMATRYGAAPVGFLGASVDVWAPPLALLAVAFYVNRTLSQQRVYGYLASAFVWAILGAELPWRWAGAAWLAFGTLLLELGVRRSLLDYRLQGYAASGCGVLALAMRTSHTLDPWTLAGGALLTLGSAIRGSRGLTALPEDERRYWRWGGSLGTALLGGILMTRLAPEPYWGLAILAFSLALLELAFRKMPIEMTVPAATLGVVGLRAVAVASGTLHKFPEQSVWLSFAGAAAGLYYVSARLLRPAAVEHVMIGMIAPWLGSAFAAACLWLVLPDSFVPCAVAALGLGLAEAGIRLRATDLKWLGRTVASVAVLGLVFLELGAAAAELATGIALAASQWWLWRRLRKDDFAQAHGWIAASVMGALIPWQAPAEMLALWSLLGAVLATAGRAFRLRDLRLQAAVTAAVVSLWSMGSGAPLWQDAAAVGFLAVALLLETRESEGTFLRQGYSIAAALVTAVMLVEQASGGMLTLSLSLEGIALLAAGFAMRERMLRLCGLTLLLLCIGKAFFYDLRNLETMYRVLSFIGLGAVLLLVSWLYTRFKEQLTRIL